MEIAASHLAGNKHVGGVGGPVPPEEVAEGAVGGAAAEAGAGAAGAVEPGDGVVEGEGEYSILAIFGSQASRILTLLSRSARIVNFRAALGEVRAAVGKHEGVGSPGVGCAHVEGVGGGGADVPRGVQVVQLTSLVDDLGYVGVVVAEALVHVAVEDDGLGRM